MIPLSGMLVGTALGVVAEVASQAAYNDDMPRGKRIALAIGFGLAAGWSLSYVISSAEEQRLQNATAKGQLHK